MKVREVEGFGLAIDTMDIAKLVDRPHEEIVASIENWGLQTLIDHKYIQRHENGYCVSHDGLCVTFGALVGGNCAKAPLLIDLVASFNRDCRAVVD